MKESESEGCRVPEFFQYSADHIMAAVLLGKLAFMNYYHLIASLCLFAAVASWLDTLAETEAPGRLVPGEGEARTVPSSPG